MIRVSYTTFILFLFFLLANIQLHPQREELTFEHITLDSGFSDDGFEAIYKDSFGFIWIGTHSGLTRYDGNEIIVYKHSDEDSCSIVSNEITDIEEDSENNLWIGTYAGLSRYVRKTDNFINFKNNPNNPHSISGNFVTGIYRDLYNNMWISTAKGGLNKIRRDEILKSSSELQFNHIKIKGLSSEIKNVRGIREDSNGNLWIGTQDGLVKLNPVTRESKLYQFIYSEKYHPKNDFFSPRIDENKIWLSTRFNGLTFFDTENETFAAYLPAKESNAYHTPNKLTRIQMDGNLIWLGTWGGGLLSFRKDKKEFIQYQNNALDPQSLILHQSHIGGLILDDMGTLWIAAYGGGITKAVREKNLFKRIWFGSSQISPKDRWRNVGWGRIHNDYEGEILIRSPEKVLRFDPVNKRCIPENAKPFDLKMLEDEYVTDILPESENIFWLATRNGLKKCNIVTGETIYFKAKKLEDQPYSYSEIFKMIKDKDGIIWLATHMGGELVSFNPISEEFSFFRYDSVNVFQVSNLTYFYRILALCEGNENAIWIVTNDGRIFSFNKLTRSFKQYEFESGIGAYSNIFEDSKGRVWIWGSEMLLLNKDTGKFKTIKIPQGFTCYVNQSFYEDAKGNVWKNTREGVLKFDGKTLEVTAYKIVYGNEALSDMYVCKSTGYLFFATVNNLYFFHPDSLRKNEKPPNVVLTSFYLFNEPVHTGQNTPLTENINVADEINLSYWQNDFSIKFSALHYVDPANNRYKYILENYDDKWRDSGNSRKADYTNISPGEYIFRVIASNSDGYWNEEGATIRIIILPPWWATIWAYIIYALILISIVFFTWKMQLKRIRIKHDYEMSKFETEKMHEVDEMKSRFFANISHEFRTPLTLIFGPAKDVLDETNEPKTKKNVGIIKRNASKLYGLVNQLLDLSKLESGKMKLESSEQNIMPLLKGLVLSFTSLAERKKITLKFNTIEENLNVYIDKDKVEKIITNLLSNAFKFTPEGGMINFTVEKLIEAAEIKIADNGIGIPKERMDKVFNRFFQVDGSHTRESEGTGIGLALTKELVELHKGEIRVESKEGEGATFTVLLPLGKEHLKTEEIVGEKIKEETDFTIEKTELIPEIENRKEKTDIDVLLDTDKPLLLIVEDNSDVRKYIISHLEGDYRIQEAVDGEDGLEQALNHIPDLIISDVMMPKMDGFELCNKLKTDEKTSHIPIIMLTAKATSQDKIEGYETGADDYIMKPFDAKELKARIKNLIEIRRKLHEKFSSDDYSIPKELNSIDEQFMKRVLNVINEHISEEEFSIEILGKESAMSRPQMYKKIKALTGKSPSLFLRSVRLVKAKKMIKEGVGTISEIAYSVGYSSPAYFTKCFSDEFGYSPSDTHQS